MRLTVISADGHASARMAEYRPYVEARYLKEFDAYVILYEARRGGSRVTPSPDVYDAEILAHYEEKMISPGAIDGEHDPHVRMKVLEEEGIVAEVLFPNGAPFLGPEWDHRLDLADAGKRAYNRWLADFCSTYPGRYAGMAAVTFNDMDRCVEEIRWARSAGLRGVAMPGQVEGKPLFWDRCYDRVWAVCQELDMPINIHGGTGVPDYSRGLTPNVPVPRSLIPAVFVLEGYFYSIRPLWFLILSGVLERFPRLRLVLTETYADWLPGMLRKLDFEWDKARKVDGDLLRACPRPPSEYWYRQGALAASLCSRAEVQLMDDIGRDNFMFGADFPHVESTFPNTKRVLNALLGGGGATVSQAEAFLSANAARVFGFDTVQLAEVAATCGPDVRDVLGPRVGDDEMSWKQYGWDVCRPAL